jgi:hypothetical protein
VSYKLLLLQLTELQTEVVTCRICPQRSNVVVEVMCVKVKAVVCCCCKLSMLQAGLSKAAVAEVCC